MEKEIIKPNSLETDLLIDEEYSPILIPDECKELKPIVKDFIGAYIKHKAEENENSPQENTKKWLSEKLQSYLPEKDSDEIKNITEEIISTINVSEQKKAELNAHISQGRPVDSWFENEAKKATSSMSVQQASKYLSDLDNAVNSANEALHRTITTTAGAISQSNALDGFIAEQYHAQTFNMNAEATGSPYRAKVLEPNGKGFAKNSVDIVILDAEGNTVRRYQSKYYSNSKATARAFESGDYRGQQKLVPEGQEGKIVKKCTTVIEAPDGTTSNPLSKEKAQQFRDEAQSGKWNDWNWDNYKNKDLVKGIGKQAGYAALQGAAIGVGFDIAKKLWDGEEIKGEEVVETAIMGGADFGVKAATAGALKVGVEKNIIKVIPKGTPASTLANIAFVAIENVKVLGKVFKGECTIRECFEKMKETTVSTVAGIAASAKGTAIGASIGTVFGPVGTAIGGFVGGTVGYIAGSEFGKGIVEAAKKIKKRAKEGIKKVIEKAREVGSRISDWVSDKWNRLTSLFA